MEQLIITSFWTGLAIVLYTYVGYGIVIYIIAKLKGRKKKFLIATERPEITVLIAAYNEAGVIEKKIKNTLSLLYPAGRMKIYIVTDGSNDGTPDIVKKYKDVHLFHQQERRGKSHAVSRIIKNIETPITVFSDANTFINPEGLINMVRHFSDQKVGGVAGEKRIEKRKADGASGSGEGLYWKYESFLKKLDSDVHSVQGAAGEFFSIRTSLYETPPPGTVIEDFYVSMKVIAQGYRFYYEPEASATEVASDTVEDEWKRKVRISAGGLQAVVSLFYLLNPFRFGIVSFQYFSHRVLRWTLAPLSLAIVLVSNFALVFIYQLPYYSLAMAAQGVLYSLALAGYLLRNRKMNIKGFFIPFYFTMMNTAVFAGFVRLVRGNQSAVWEKLSRSN